jgi:hypothetical protein
VDIGAVKAERRRVRQAQLDAMSDDQLRDEVAHFQSAPWEDRAVEEHLRKRRREFIVQLGIVPTAIDVERLGRDTVAGWERVFTEVRPNGQVSYVFYRFEQRAACGTMSVVRDDVIKTTFFVSDVDAWVRRNPQAIEVTGRVTEPRS